ncbi:hypothetical protein SAMN02745355_1105 [Picrophilus oshimae DSM 9789]|nr:hypothetical protein SAMN02745355_1105 [Picrophilus oshimae DSM 9789]
MADIGIEKQICFVASKESSLGGCMDDSSSYYLIKSFGGTVNLYEYMGSIESIETSKFDDMEITIEYENTDKKSFKNIMSIKINDDMMKQIMCMLEPSFVYIVITDSIITGNFADFLEKNNLPVIRIPSESSLKSIINSLHEKIFKNILY